VPPLRNAALAIIEPEKVQDYLLYPDNPQNGGKAEALFRMGIDERTGSASSMTSESNT